MEEAEPTTNQQSSSSKQIQVEALASLLQGAGLEPADLLTALTTLAESKKATETPPETGRSIYQDKELVYEDESAFIYRRGDTRNKIYYLRFYDKKRKKPFVKSLGYTDRVKALTKARLIYQHLQGKVDRGERLKTITSPELVKIHLERYEKKVTDIPRQGITPETFRRYKLYLSQWLEFLDHIGMSSRSIDQIKPEWTRDYGYWLLKKPRPDGQQRGVEQINASISEINKMYHQVAVRDRYISKDLLPEIDRLKLQPDNSYKRDILSVKQYEKLWKFMYYKWIPEKGISHIEKQKRIIFYNVIGILYNTGLRSKELIGLKVMEITQNEADTKELQQTHLKIKIRATNSKTGKSRIIVSPIKKRVDRIKKAYKELGLEHQSNDYFIFNPTDKKRKPYTRGTLYDRLQTILELSGLKKELAEEGKRVSLYSSRHAFITWRLRYGNVPIHLVAKVAGTSIQKIEQTYGHIEVEKQTELLTRNQGYAKTAEVDLIAKLEVEEITFRPDINILEEKSNKVKH
jgi:integrase